MTYHVTSVKVPKNSGALGAHPLALGDMEHAYAR